MSPERRGPLRNRVTPRGDLIAVAARGALMGNRGQLHDAAGQVVRRQVSGYRAWVTCRLDFKGRWRPVMTPGRYTELFFLDEATALAAGHRPCGECRRDDFRRFKAAWLAANPERGLAEGMPIGAVDRELHRDRLTSEGLQQTFLADLGALPDGVFVARGAQDPLLLVWDGGLWPWSPDGYGDPEPKPPSGVLTVLTPASTVNTIAAGYTPGCQVGAGPAATRARETGDSARVAQAPRPGGDRA
jgi:hypothetical protein